MHNPYFYVKASIWLQQNAQSHLEQPTSPFILKTKSFLHVQEGQKSSTDSEAEEHHDEKVELSVLSTQKVGSEARAVSYTHLTLPTKA